MDRTDIQSAFDSLQDDIEALRPRHRSSPEFQDLTHQVIGRIHSLDIDELARTADISNEDLVIAVEKVRGSVRSFFDYAPGVPPPGLLPYMGEVREWVASLAGDPTTPPPIFLEEVGAK